MLSAYDYGQRALEKGRPNAFSHLSDFEKLLAFIDDYVRIWEKWQAEKEVLIARYEDLLMEYDAESARLVKFLRVDGSKPEVQEVIEGYRPGKAKGQQGLHFYKGKIGRFRESYSVEQQTILNERFAPYLQKMGYET